MFRRWMKKLDDNRYSLSQMTCISIQWYWGLQNHQRLFTKRLQGKNKKEEFITNNQESAKEYYPFSSNVFSDLTTSNCTNHSTHIGQRTKHIVLIHGAREQSQEIIKQAHYRNQTTLDRDRSVTSDTVKPRSLVIAAWVGEE